MPNLPHYYPVNNSDELRRYLSVYLPLVIEECRRFSIDVRQKRFQADHLGLQVLNSEEFDHVSTSLLAFSTIVKDEPIQHRRNQVFRFAVPVEEQGFQLSGIEIFEPKPGESLSKLRAGVEHIAFVVHDYEDFLSEVAARGIPIAKKADYGSGEFFKTVFLNGVEVEFRSSFLTQPSRSI